MCRNYAKDLCRSVTLAFVRGTPYSSWPVSLEALMRLFPRSDETQASHLVSAECGGSSGALKPMSLPLRVKAKTPDEV